MELALDKSVDTSLNVPKMSMRTFEIKSSYYVVTDGTIFNYYNIATHPDEDSSPLIRFKKSPPILLEGVAIVNKKVYHVSTDDLLRRVIRKSKEIIQEATNAGTNRSSSSKSKSSGDSIASITSNPVQLTDQPGIVAETEMEIAKASDLTWENQIGALLHHLSAEEGYGVEWETADDPQS